jgi:hypothetical protein
MASIEVIVRDDQGKILRQSVDEDVKLSSLSLRGVESAVERWRHKVLPKVEATLLEAAQQEFTEAQKTNLIYDGIYDGTDMVRSL